jgi:hypothetical protein
MRNRRSPELTPAADQPRGRETETDPVQGSPSKLRELAAWYREFAERAGNPTIWEARLRLAEELDAEADHIDRIKQAEPQRKRGTGLREFERARAIRRQTA